MFTYHKAIYEHEIFFHNEDNDDKVTNHDDVHNSIILFYTSHVL